MRIVNMHEAKTHLSRLVEAAADGEPFITLLTADDVVARYPGPIRAI